MLFGSLETKAVVPVLCNGPHASGARHSVGDCLQVLASEPDGLGPDGARSQNGPPCAPKVIGGMQVALPNEPTILEAFHRPCALLFDQA